MLLCVEALINSIQSRARMGAAVDADRESSSSSNSLSSNRSTLAARPRAGGAVLLSTQRQRQQQPHLRWLRLLALLCCCCCWTARMVTAEIAVTHSNGGFSRFSTNNNNNINKNAAEQGNANRRASSFIRKGDLPHTGTDWISVHETVEFLPASPETASATTTGTTLDWLLGGSSWAASSPTTTTNTAFGTGQLNRMARQQQQQQLDQRLLEEETDDSETFQNREDNPQYRVQPFVEGVSDYDGYQQAWRLLGFMIDCDDTWMMNTDDNYNNNGGGGSHDENDTGLGCARYVIWAAYVDLDYQGGGIGEYVYWDRKKKAWDNTACQYSGSKRCAKMDCHLDSTHFSLLGFFKHKSYDDWLEQLFKHEGICIWTDEEYAFMSSARKTWPQGCVLSGTTTQDGNAIYYDLKPVQGGGITFALYTDERCVEEYQPQGKNDPINIENVIGNVLVEGGSGDSQDKNYDFSSTYGTLEASLEAWDNAFDIFKICQPCVAHDLLNYGYNGKGQYGSNYGKYTYGYDDDYSYKNNNGADFDCYDAADYTNVNQCMKFMAKTTMNTATFRDITLATSQGTLADKPLSGYRVTKKRRRGFFLTYLYLIGATYLFVFAILKFLKIRRINNFAPHWDAKEPLGVFS